MALRSSEMSGRSLWFKSSSIAATSSEVDRLSTGPSACSGRKNINQATARTATKSAIRMIIFVMVFSRRRAILAKNLRIFASRRSFILTRSSLTGGVLVAAEFSSAKTGRAIPPAQKTETKSKETIFLLISLKLFLLGYILIKFDNQQNQDEKNQNLNERAEPTPHPQVLHHPVAIIHHNPIIPYPPRSSTGARGYLLLKLFGKVTMLAEVFLGIFKSLPQAGLAVGKGRAGFFHKLVFESEVQKVALVGNTLIIHDIKLRRPKRRGYFIFHHFGLHAIPDNLLPFFNLRS